LIEKLRISQFSEIFGISEIENKAEKRHFIGNRKIELLNYESHQLHLLLTSNNKFIGVFTVHPSANRSDASDGRFDKSVSTHQGQSQTEQLHHADF
jgi:hypothetical protein